MECKIELQRSNCILWRDRRYVAFGTYLDGAYRELSLLYVNLHIINSTKQDDCPKTRTICRKPLEIFGHLFHSQVIVGLLYSSIVAFEGYFSISLRNRIDTVVRLHLGFLKGTIDQSEVTHFVCYLIFGHHHLEVSWCHIK